jgi:GNAT superfamily N-acetyltransferase
MVSSLGVELVTFRDELLADAAALVAARGRRDRDALPELPARFEEAEAARVAVEAAWRRPGASGAAALEGGRLVGYLVGDVIVDSFRGRAAWVRLAGHAIAVDVDAELYRDLYAAAGRRWLAHGCFLHYALVPATDEAALAAWGALGFGRDQAYALRPLTDADDEPGCPPEGVTIRRAARDDREALAELSSLIARANAEAPAWVPISPEGLAELRQGYAELVDDPSWTVWLALDGDEALGFQAYVPARAAEDDLLTPEGCVELKVAGTREVARGRGIGRALTRHGLAQARADGYAYCLADWHVPNLLASRFWPRQGFRPAVYRLARRLDPRIAWADGRMMEGENRSL